ncbi:hypothetical protein NIES4072_35720 [Nostoc commune NIES-4072]|uniref:Uncharacterized protein n=2 Tax=Nostoc commune TaxID=1178 RepID=A0A2R5FUL1_NOSCO|nr:hypothetical protein NIES4070_55070 [Nostoc commune HK-02]GBG19903.1 hypothetical protein NIES4072_35720 [Nostoc commune NIES-4072]
MMNKKVKTKIQNFCKLVSVFISIFVVSPAYASDWLLCGNLSQIDVNNGCQIPNYPSGRYEYAISYNTNEPLPVVCSSWNVGLRIYNKQPYMVLSDNPSAGMSYGGFIFYRGTQASDDATATCSSGEWRHRYWRLTQNNAIQTDFYGSNGCYGAELPVYCRARKEASTNNILNFEQKRLALLADSSLLKSNR